MKTILLKITIGSILLFLLSACTAESAPQNNKIVEISEASGISFCDKSNTLMVANDEGSFYEITPQGAILSKHKLGKYDLEGVVCEEEEIIFAVEDGSILIVSRESLKVKELKIKGQKFKFSKKAGIEGIVKIKDSYYVSIQSKKEKDSKLLVLKLGVNYAKITEIINHKIIDSAGLEYKDKKLYIVSDKKDTLYVYNLKKNKISKKIKLPKFDQEGVAFGNNNDIFFADDKGAVMHYSLKELGI
jgi:hypothetical protein